MGPSRRKGREGEGGREGGKGKKERMGKKSPLDNYRQMMILFVERSLLFFFSHVGISSRARWWWRGRCR